MKCQKCNCQVSDDFKYAFDTNCCPKCGQELMQKNVKSLFLQMRSVLGRDNNDVGDLAVWFINSYLPSQSVNVGSEESSTSDLLEEFTINKPVSIATTGLPMKSPFSKTVIDNKLVQSERASMFAKRAGVDKIKFETLIKDIQETDLANEVGSSYNTEPGFEDSSIDFDKPLSKHELLEVTNLIDKSSNAMDFKEIEKLQRLEQLQTTGSVGKIKRSS